MIVVSSALLLGGVLLEHFAPAFISDTFGAGANETWQEFQFFLGLAWVLFIIFMLLSSLLVFLDERKVREKNTLVLNEQKEIVLSDSQKKVFAAKQELELTFLFNSLYCGFEPFDEIDEHFKFATPAAEGEAAEADLQRYVKNNLGRSVCIEPGRNERTRRWDRVIVFRNSDE